MLAVLPENHPLSKNDVIPLGLLATEPFILLEEGHYYEPLDAFKSIGVSPNIKYTIHDDYAIMADRSRSGRKHFGRAGIAQNKL